MCYDELLFLEHCNCCWDYYYCHHCYRYYYYYY
jgi:hypothetical protein